MLAGLKLLRERYDAVLVDLDGTILNDASELTDRTVAAFQALVDEGMQVVICTGRNRHGARESHARLGLDTPVVAFNGAWIGPPDGPPERALLLQREHVRALDGLAADAVFDFRHALEGSYTTESDHPFHETAQIWYDPLHRVAREDLPEHDLFRMSLFFDRPAHHTRAWPPPMWRGLPSRRRAAFRLDSWNLSVFPKFAASDMSVLDVHVRCEGKAEVYPWLEQTRGIPAGRTVAIGDQHNDLELLRGAGLAVAMENAIDGLKEVADLVIGHNDRDGVAEWIERGAPVAPL